MEGRSPSINAFFRIFRESTSVILSRSSLPKKKSAIIWGFIIEYPFFSVMSASWYPEALINITSFFILNDELPPPACTRSSRIPAYFDISINSSILLSRITSRLPSVLANFYCTVSSNSWLMVIPYFDRLLCLSAKFVIKGSSGSHVMTHLISSVP